MEQYKNYFFFDNYKFLDDSLKLMMVFALSSVVIYALSFILKKAMHFICKQHKDQVFINAISTPFLILSFAVSFVALFRMLDIYSHLFDHSILISIRSLVTVICIGWFCIRYSHLLQHRYLNSKQETSLDKGAVDTIGKLVTVVVLVVVILLVMDILGFDIRGLLTFAGVGGIAFAFASKELLSNFFGTIIIYFDKPFVVGDFIKTTKDIGGFVEHIGWRMTRIRTVEKTPIYIPNSIFSSEIIENCTRRTHRMIKEVVGIRYEDIKVLELVIKDIKTFLESHKKVEVDQPIVVGFENFADSSVDFLVRVCVEFSNINDFYDIKTEIMLYIYKIIKNHKADMAFPTRTILGEIKCDILNEKGKI
ncbi:MAG: mechanosensitive ion channel family protein [Rickettsiales bacterium]|nr:mechanosensitive ion channel family protein [Rickettsiales bacterium]